MSIIEAIDTPSISASCDVVRSAYIDVNLMNPEPTEMKLDRTIDSSSVSTMNTLKSATLSMFSTYLSRAL